LHLRAVRARLPEKRGKPACKWARAPKRQSCSTKLYTWICKTVSDRAMRLTSLLAFRILGIRQHARRFAPCQLDEGWRSPKTKLSCSGILSQSRAATSRIPFCSPRAGTKNRMRLPREDIASDPKPDTWISCTASLRKVPSPRPWVESQDHVKLHNAPQIVSRGSAAHARR
jgi:hypothetical protein